MSFYSSVVLADKPAAYYRLSETTGTTATDGTGIYPGTYQGIETLNQPGALSDHSPSVLWDGSTGYVACPSSLSTTGLGALSIESWFYIPSTLGHDCRIVANDHVDLSQVGFQLSISSGNTGGLFSVGFGGGVATNNFWPYTFANNTWYHIVATFTNGLSTGNTVVYINGAVVNAFGTNTGTIAAAGFPINLGRGAYGNDYFPGRQQDVSIYFNKALTPAQVLAHYNAGLTASASAVPIFPRVHTHLSLTAYIKSGGSPTTKTFTADQITSLSISSIAPGGFGDLKCDVLVPDNRQVPPELQLFAYVAVMDGPFAVFLGRWDEPAIALDSSNGPMFHLSAQGAATVLKDDPLDCAYVNQTALQIVQNQYTAGSPSRSNYFLLDSDTSAVLPDNPSYQFTESFAGATVEDVLNKLTPILGDYQWGVWAHQRNKDVAGFPTWQLQYHIRDATTTAYLALPDDIASYQITPSVEYSYNIVTLLYRDATTNLPSSVTVYDGRLTATYAQGTAPFPARRLRKDLGSVSLSATQATAIANALLNDYKNGGFKVEIVLEQVRNAYGVPIPLWQVQADHTISVPNISITGVALPFAPKANVNQFYIIETQFDEGTGNGQTPTITITANANKDTAGFQIARLQYQADQASKNVKTLGVIQAPGAAETGKCGMAFVSGGAAQIWGQAVNFKTVMSQAPTSITLTASSQTNVTSVTTADIKATGFQLVITATASGAALWYGQYTTNGN